MVKRKVSLQKNPPQAPKPSGIKSVGLPRCGHAKGELKKRGSSPGEVTGRVGEACGIRAEACRPLSVGPHRKKKGGRVGKE